MHVCFTACVCPCLRLINLSQSPHFVHSINPQNLNQDKSSASLYSHPLCMDKVCECISLTLIIFPTIPSSNLTSVITFVFYSSPVPLFTLCISLTVSWLSRSNKCSLVLFVNMLRLSDLYIFLAYTP